MEAKLMSYNQQGFPSKVHMESKVREIEDQVDRYSEHMAAAGLVSFMLTQVWNKQGKFRLGSYFVYRDERAFVNCQKIFNGMPQDEEKPAIEAADRGVVLLNFEAGK